MPAIDTIVSSANPFRGLNFFDFEHAAFYHGRRKAVGEVLEVLQSQAKGNKRFVIVLGPSGSGKSSLVRAGILPALTQGGTVVGNRPWVYAVTRPGATRDPFNALAAAVAGKVSLPELPEASSVQDSLNLASQLRKGPHTAAARIAEVLTRPNRQPGPGERGAMAPSTNGLSVRGAGPKRLALVIDQLEELFTGVSPVLQEKYIAALSALVRCEGVFVIATLRSDFYPHCRRFPELLKLISLGGRYELQPPTPSELGEMIRVRVEAAGLRFERNPETGRSLDEALLKAARTSPDQLPLLEHLLSRLYQRQLERKDSLLLWSDYRELGELGNALTGHAEFVFLTLNRDEQQALKFVARHLLAPSQYGESLLNRRTVPYDELVASTNLDRRQRAGAKGLVDRLIKEGLLSAENDPEKRRLISIPQEALLRRWPRLWQVLSEDPHVLEMRDRLETRVRFWLGRGCRGNDLLAGGIGLAEARNLLKDFTSSLNERQIDFVQKSIARQNRRRRVRQNIALSALIVFAVIAAFVGVDRFNAARRRDQSARAVQRTSPDATISNQGPSLEAKVKKTEQQLQLAQFNADLANKQRSALENQLRETLEVLEQVRGNSNREAGQLSELQTQLKREQDKAQKAQTDADSANRQRSDLEAELKQVQAEKTELAQQNADLVSQEKSTPDSQLKGAQDKLEQAQGNSDGGASQLRELQAQLKQEQDQAQKAQADADSANSQQTALETELKKVQAEKTQLAQQNADLVNRQQSTLETQLKTAQAKLQQLQANSDRAASQLSDVQAQLKQEQDKAQKARADADSANSQQTALETQLKAAQDKLQQAQANSDRAASQLSELQTQLKQEQDKEQKSQIGPDSPNSLQSARAVEENSDQGSSQVSALETQSTQKQEAEQTGTPAPNLTVSNSGPDQDSGEKEMVKQVALAYLETLSSNDRSKPQDYLSDRVYGRGILNSSAMQRYKTRDLTPRGETKVVRLKSQKFGVYQPYKWTASDGIRHVHGSAALYLLISKNSRGEYRIVSVHQLRR